MIDFEGIVLQKGDGELLVDETGLKRYRKIPEVDLVHTIFGLSLSST